MRDDINPKDVFKSKPDMLAGRIKSANEDIPGPDDAEFLEKVERMTAFLIGESETPGSPPRRNSIVIANLVREMTGSNPEDIQRTLWENDIRNWQEDPNFFTAVGLIFALQTKDDTLHDRLTMGLLSQSSVASARPKR